MIRGIVFVPGSPLLLPGLGGAADVLGPLRAVCRQAVADLGPGPLVVLGEGEGAASRQYPSGERASGWGPVPSASVPQAGLRAGLVDLPAALVVGASLLDGRGATLVAVSGDGAMPLLPAGAALVAVGDGSARRGLAAPLPTDERAEAFDGTLAGVLAGGDPARLLEIDTELALELGAGVAAWRVAARVAAAERRTWSARLLAHEWPLGVCYLAASWT